MNDTKPEEPPACPANLAWLKTRDTRVRCHDAVVKAKAIFVAADAALEAAQQAVRKAEREWKDVANAAYHADCDNHAAEQDAVKCKCLKTGCWGVMSQ